MGVPHPSSAAERVVLSAARIGADVAEGVVPRSKQFFLLSAAVVEGATRHDATALQLGLDAIAALVDDAPDGPEWDWYRGHLNAAFQFAWLLARVQCPEESFLAS